MWTWCLSSFCLGGACTLPSHPRTATLNEANGRYYFRRIFFFSRADISVGGLRGERSRISRAACVDQWDSAINYISCKRCHAFLLIQESALRYVLALVGRYSCYRIQCAVFLYFFTRTAIVFCNEHNCRNVWSFELFVSIIRKTFYLPINAKAEALPNEKRKKKREKRCTYAREQTHTHPFYLFSTLDLQHSYTRARILPQEVHEQNTKTSSTVIGLCVGSYSL